MSCLALAAATPRLGYEQTSSDTTGHARSRPQFAYIFRLLLKMSVGAAAIGSFQSNFSSPGASRAHIRHYNFHNGMGSDVFRTRVLARADALRSCVFCVCLEGLSFKFNQPSRHARTGDTGEVTGTPGAIHGSMV